MIDDLNTELERLAATVDSTVDLTVLHRRIARDARRRGAIRVGAATVAVGAVVGGLFVLRTDGPTPAADAISAAEAVTTSVPATTVPLVDCATIAANQKSVAPAESAAGSVPPEMQDASASSEADFKAPVTIVAVDGDQISYHADVALPAGVSADGVAVVDAATLWLDGNTRLTVPATLEAGQLVGMAAKLGADGVNRVVFIDTGASSAADNAADKPVSIKALVTIVAVDGDQVSYHADVPMPVGASADGVAVVDAATLWLDGNAPLAVPATLEAGQIVGMATTLGADGLNHVLFIDTAPSHARDGGATSAGQAAADGKAPDDNSTQVPSSAVAASTDKSRATVTATEGTTITLSLAHDDGSPTTAAADSTSVPFFAGDTQCAPGDIAVGTTLGAAYHVYGGNTIIDALMLDS
jgi:hypothetical protein